MIYPRRREKLTGGRRARTRRISEIDAEISSLRTADSAIGDLRVVDFGVGMTAALIAKQMADFGARVSRIEPEGGDPAYQTYPAYGAWRGGASRGHAAEAGALLDVADVCIVGGEDFPGLPPHPSIEKLTRDRPRLIVLRITGYPTADPRRPAVDLLVQARTGIVFEQFSDRPIAAGLPMPSYGAALQGLLALWVAIVERERSGLGQVVTISLAGGAAMFWGPFWMQAEKADPMFIGITPRDVRQLILRCANEEYLQITMGVPGAIARVHDALGLPPPDDLEDPGMPNPSRGPANFYGDVDLFNSAAVSQTRADLLAALRKRGVPCEPVLKPGEAWDDPQTRENGVLTTGADGWRTVGSPVRLKALDVAPGSGRERLRDHDPDGPPLKGLRIVDCGIFVAGPYASKLLADYGAEVIQVERPVGRSTLSGERTIISANYGKRAILVDAKSETGPRVLAELCRRADIVLHNFRPGVAHRIGMGQEVMRQLNPGLVILETTAYGACGPKAEAPGFDMVIQAFSGLDHRAGGEGNTPLCSRTPMVDFATGAVGAIGLLAAVYERLRTGRAMSLETNLLNVGLHMLSEVVEAPDGKRLGAPVLNPDQTGFHPAECLYRAADGWLAVAVRSDGQAEALARVLEISLPADRTLWGEPERALIGDAFRGRSADRLAAALEDAGVWVEPCLCDAWETPERRGSFFVTIEDQRYGEVLHCIGALAEFSRSTTVPSQRLATTPGQDGAEILAELGIS